MLYVHIPFCSRKCFYCGFVSVNNQKLWDKYFEKLYIELKQRKNNAPVSSIYFGGGTPSIVDIKYIQKCMSIINNNYNVQPDAEITIEANPTLTVIENLEKYRQMGFNRISFGVQSLDEQKLAKLGRNQSRQDAVKCIKKACEVFENVSADLLIGLEGQTKEEVLKDIDTLYDVGIKHLSVYMLMVEDETKLFDIVKEKKYVPLDDDQAVNIYDAVMKHLKSKNVFRYEISNFAKKNYHSRHNLGYWQMKDYLGFGAAAHSFVKNKRFYNSENIAEYTENNIVKNEDLNEEQLNEERIMLGLRTMYGVEERYIKNKTQLEKLLQDGFVKRVEDRIVICEECFNVANQIILKLI